MLLDFETPTRAEYWAERREREARELADREARAARYRGPYLTGDECRARYPRLARACAYVAILSSGETGSALRELRAGWERGGCEAVAHFGGPRVVISRAWACRHHVARLARLQRGA